MFSTRALRKKLFQNGNVAYLSLTAALTGMYVSMLNAILQPFTLSLGIGLTGLGVLQAVGNRFTGVAGSIAQPLAGHLSDVRGRKPVIVLGSILSLACMVSFSLAAVERSQVALIVGFVFFGLSLLGTPAIQAMIAESVQLDKRRMDVAFSAIFFFTALPGAIMAFTAGILADTLGYYLVFILAFSLEAANLALYMIALKETKRMDQEKTGNPGILGLFKIPRGLGGFYATMASDALTAGITVTIIYGMLFKSFGFTNTDIGLIVGTVSLAVIFAQYPATRLLLRFGSRAAMALSQVLYLILLVGWLLSESLQSFILLSILFAAAIALWVPALQSLLMKYAPQEERGSAGGKLAAFRGIIGFPAPIIGGALFDTFGYLAPISVSLLGGLIVLCMIMLLLPREHVEAKS